MEYEIRSVSADELEEFRRCQASAFGNEFSTDHLEAGRQIFEAERSLAAFDDGRIIGTSGIFSFELTVPGGDPVKAAGVSMVSVKPTHRRRGVLTGIMARQLAAVRDRGEALAILWASESAIYGRFGYGIATQMELLRVPHEYGAMRRDVPPSAGRLRLLSADEARELLPALHERARRLSPGAVSRTAGWWEIRIFRDHPDHRGGYGSNNYLVYEEGGEIAGYLIYRRRDDSVGWIPGGKALVRECVPATKEAYAALWRYVLELDLVQEIEYDIASGNEPLLWMLEDSRRTERRRLDAIWLRVVDVEKALSARAYGGEGRLVIEVEDAVLEGAGGRFELVAGLGDGICRRTDEAPDLVMGASELGSLYLGGGSAWALWRAGRIAGGEHAVALAERLFGWHVPPHCQEHF